MMSLLLSSVSVSALIGVVPPVILDRVKWTTGVSNYDIDASGTEFTSTTTSGQYFTFSEKVMGLNTPFPEFKGFYWEVEFTGTATGNHNSYTGVMKSSNTGFGYPQDLTWRGNGSLYKNGSYSGSAGIYTNNDRLMFCFNPYTGEMWVGKNGVWVNDPAVDPANITGDIGTYVANGQNRFGSGNGGILHSTIETNAYTVPTNAVALADSDKMVFDDLTLSGSVNYLIFGSRTDATTLSKTNTHTVFGKNSVGVSFNNTKSLAIFGKTNNGPSINRHLTYLILE